MPDTASWRLVTGEQHRPPPPLDVATLDQMDALMEECARVLGRTLDRQTIEGAIFGISAARYVQHHAYGHERDEELGPDFEREMTIALTLVRWLLVERLHRMEGT